MYAVLRLNSFDPAKVAVSADRLDEFDKIHAAQSGYVGSVVVELGAGRRFALNLWETEQNSAAALQVLGPEVGQGGAVGRVETRVGERDGEPGRAALPDAHQPHGVDGQRRDRVPLGVRHVAELAAQALEPDCRVDLVDGHRASRKISATVPVQPV